MKKKNLLFVFADQWRRSAMGFAKDDPVITPNMDRFAASGVYCENAVSSYPVCSPHRASLFTGRQTLSTGVFTNCKPGVDVHLKQEEITLGDVLKAQGYATGYIGKWHLDEPEVNFCPEPASGARDWDAYTPAGPGRHGFDHWLAYNTFDDHFNPHYWSDGPVWTEPHQWSPIFETDQAIAFLKQQSSEQPFGLVVSFNPPHTPYNLVPDRYLDLYRDMELPRRPNIIEKDLHVHTGQPVPQSPEELLLNTKRYYAAVSGIDDQFGRLLKALDDLGLREDTCVILSADHGEMMGSHGLMAKHVWYEESIGIPFVLAGPGLTPGRCSSVFNGADMMPTMLDWLDLPIPDTAEGISQLQAIREHRKEDPQEAYICCCPGMVPMVEAHKKVGLDPREFGWRALRTQRYTYVIDLGYCIPHHLRYYLYDNQADPFQMRPVCPADPSENSVTAELDAHLRQKLADYHDGFLRHLPGKNN